MRIKCIDFVVGALLIILLDASVAHAHLSSKQPLGTNAIDQSMIRKDPIGDLHRARAILVPRMFNWDLCGISNSGRADSADEWSLQRTQDSPPLNNVCSRGCVDDDEEEPTLAVDLTAGPTLVETYVANPTWSACAL
jgi:hypothetical protein